MAVPKVFLARCLCGSVVGAVDFTRCDKSQIGNLLGEWLYKGYTIEPKFERIEITINECRC